MKSVFSVSVLRRVLLTAFFLAPASGYCWEMAKGLPERFDVAQNEACPSDVGSASVMKNLSKYTRLQGVTPAAPVIPISNGLTR